MTQRISAHEATEILIRTDTLLIDVREPAEHASVHISAATLAPLSKLSGFAVPQGITEIIVHCKTGIRADKAIKQLQQRFPNIRFYNMDKGIEGWQQAGFDVERPVQTRLSLDRQVQLANGGLVSVGIALGYFAHPGWLLLSGASGLVSLVSGLTGSNPLALALARMPWNQK